MIKIPSTFSALLILGGTLTLSAQMEQPKTLNVDGEVFPLYPQTIENFPNLPSPFQTPDGRTFIVAGTQQNDYAVFPVTLNNDSYWKALVVDEQDFPTLARTGLHDERELAQTTTITGRPVEEITRLARPGGLSQDGFLAGDEDILSVLTGDNHLVHRLELTHPAMARPLFYILKMMETDLALNRWNMAKHEWENIRHFWYNGHIVFVEAHDTKGGQLSPFDDGIEGGFYIIIHRTLSDEEINFLRSRYSHLNEDQYEKLVYLLTHILTGEMEPQYIMRYGFYEGHTEWRTDPITIAFMFGLKSLPAIEAAFPGDLYGVLTRHFTRETPQEGGQQ